MFFVSMLTMCDSPLAIVMLLTLKLTLTLTVPVLQLITKHDVVYFQVDLAFV